MSAAVEPDLEAIVAGLEARGISASRLCRRAEIAFTTWHRWRTGESVPTRTAVWQRVTRAYGELVAEHGNALPASGAD